MITTETSKRTKVMLMGTHPKQFNGYSKVVYEISKYITEYKDIEFMIYGFQNFYNNDKHRTDIPKDVFIYDAYAGEEPKGTGFGINEIENFVKTHKPDVVIVYNDVLVLTNCIAKLRSSGVPMKIIAYIDQVYLCQKREFIQAVNQTADYALAFTPYWEEILKEQNIKLPTNFLRHGFNSDIYFPIPKEIARRYFGLRPDDFIILNLNRNQPRKRWDVCLKAFAEVVSRLPDSNIKMMIGTGVQGGWNLLELYERELKKRNVTMEVGMRHVIILDNPQKITDEETNILYNVADIGINTCDGEGFGLCNFEQAGVGIPQVVPRIGGFRDFFDDECAYLCDPTIAYYVDNSRDAVCGEALMCDYMDFVDGILAYYENPTLRETHGKRCREKILKEYKWSDIVKKLHSIVRELIPAPLSEAKGSEIDKLKEEIEKIDITSLKVLSQETPATKEESGSKKKKKSAKHSEELKKLQSQINAILASINDDDNDDNED